LDFVVEPRGVEMRLSGTVLQCCRLPLVAGVSVMMAIVTANGAGAQVLNNRDDVSRNVTVMAKSARRLVAVEPGRAISDFCPDGCVIRVDEDETRDFLIEGNERLSIENGLVYFDGEIASKDGAVGETPAGDAGDGDKGAD
jgi:hypothetical protein